MPRCEAAREEGWCSFLFPKVAFVVCLVCFQLCTWQDMGTYRRGEVGALLELRTNRTEVPSVGICRSPIYGNQVKEKSTCKAILGSSSNLF